MKKNIKVTIKTNDILTIEKYSAIYQEKEKILKYKEKNFTNVKLYINEDLLTRDNDELYLEYKFQKNIITDGKILIKEYNKEINLGIDTINIYKTDSIYEIEYKLIDSNDIFYYKIEMEK